MMPRLDGFGLLKALRADERTRRLPVILLSARAGEEASVEGMDSGADDYLVKPFSSRELLARVRAALRRGVRGSAQTPLLHIGKVTIDLTRREARSPDGDLHLTPLEYRVLESLARQAGMIVTAGQLIQQAWGPDRPDDDTRNLRVCLKNLRQKLEPDAARPRYIVMEPGLGYRLRVSE
jgi:two-component system KDP operon response regulator KdpE